MSSFQILDSLQAIFWTLAYIFMAIYMIKYQSLSIHPNSVAINFSWESVVIFKGILEKNAHWINLLWFGFDLIIVVIMCRYLSKKEIRNNFIFYIVLMHLFFDLLYINRGLLISTFVMDFVMGITFLYMIKKDMFKYYNKLLLCTAIFKTIGSIFAWQAYAKYSTIIPVLGFIVLIFNIIYITEICRKLNKIS